MPAALLTVILAASAAVSLSFGIRQTFGLFLLPLAQEAAIAPAVFGAAVALHNLVWGFAQPVSGAMADRFGAGRVIACGGFLYVAGLGMMALWPGEASAVVGIGLLTGLGVACAGSGTANSAVARAAPPEKRGEMLGLASAGGSVGQALMVPAVQAAILGWGAVGAIGMLALASLLVLPVGRCLEWRPAPRPPGGPRPVGLAGLPALARNALADRDFALLTLGFFACGFQLAFLVTHLPAHLALCGLPAGLGATALMLVGLFNIPGSWFCGWLAGRVRPELVLGLLYLIRTTAVALFALAPPSSAGTLVFAAVMGATWLGTVPLTNAAIARRFGVADIGALFGVCFMSHQIGGFLGAGSAAVLVNATGSYALFWPVMVMVGLMAAVANFVARPPRVALA
ncbi:MFS transporter [Roseomonas sp. NAR14]|uniref:MFS transporter n=1 Tax=Roseomonas acroporae TaxID=2937791 RepID=A0A9X1Y8E4_9PROT|nr:MFS transporter [Roseomonas acroporae]MCK8785391.1 MFS transporter [Roseomonas acroporae]